MSFTITEKGFKSRLILIILLIIVYLISAKVFFPQISSVEIRLKTLSQQAQQNFSLKLPFVKVTKEQSVKIVGGGKLLLPASFSINDNADLTVLHGTDFSKIKSFLQNNDNINSGKIVITSMALETLLLHEKGLFIKPFLDNFQKSGDIKNNSGKKFYYMEELIFSVKENLSGIVLSFPAGKYFSKVKNYGLAHLIQNNFSLEGLMNPVKFLESLNFPKPKGFEGSFEDLIKQGAKEYNEKFQAKVITMNFAKGKRISPQLIPMMPAKKNAKFLPLLESIQLSDNIWFSGLTLEQ